MYLAHVQGFFMNHNWWFLYADYTERTEAYPFFHGDSALSAFSVYKKSCSSNFLEKTVGARAGVFVNLDKALNIRED